MQNESERCRSAVDMEQLGKKPFLENHKAIRGLSGTMSLGFTMILLLDR